MSPRDGVAVTFVAVRRIPCQFSLCGLVQHRAIFFVVEDLGIGPLHTAVRTRGVLTSEEGVKDTCRAFLCAWYKKVFALAFLKRCVEATGFKSEESTAVTSSE